MELLNNLTKIKSKSQKRVGRGFGSTKGGHTTGRGAKGDKIRGKTKLTFDGTKIKKSWIKRLPFLRGKHRVLSHSNLASVTLDQLTSWFSPKDTIDTAAILKKAKYPQAIKRIKIIGGKNQLSSVLNLKGLVVSPSIKSKIESAGGKIEV